MLLAVDCVQIHTLLFLSLAHSRIESSMWNLTQKTRATQVEFVGWRFICDLKGNSIFIFTKKSDVIYITQKSECHIKEHQVLFRTILITIQRVRFAMRELILCHQILRKYQPKLEFLARFQLKQELRKKLRDESISEKRSDA